MRTSHASTLIFLSLLLAAPASATPAIAIEPVSETRPTDDPGMEVGAGLQLGGLAGSSSIGEVDGLALGLAVAATVRLADLALVGEFDHIRLGGSRHDGDETRGTLTRGGLSLRHRLINIAPEGDESSANVWLEVGAGRQRIAWREGGTLTRNDVVLGAAIQLDGLSAGEDGHTRSFGPYFAFRTVITRAPEADGAMATCGGPCDAPGQPSAHDISTWFSVGMHWGR